MGKYTAPNIPHRLNDMGKYYRRKRNGFVLAHVAFVVNREGVLGKMARIIAGAITYKCADMEKF